MNISGIMNEVAKSSIQLNLKYSSTFIIPGSSNRDIWSENTDVNTHKTHDAILATFHQE